jgi:hypothetical protein
MKRRSSLKIFKVNTHGGKIRNIYTKGLAYNCTAEILAEELRYCDDFKFIDSRTGKDTTFRRLIPVFRHLELESQRPKDIELLNRIIRGGGFMQYLERLNNAPEAKNL